MAYLLFLLTVLIPLTSLALPSDEARLFVSSIRKKDFCSREFLRLLNGDLRELALLLHLDSCSPPSVYAEPENPYGKLRLAFLLKKAGREKEARELYLKVFSSTNNLDEDILFENRGDTSYLFKPEILRKKVWLAAKGGEKDTALFYLSYLRDDPYYTYLLAYTFLKSGKRKRAKELFRISAQDERYYFLMLLSKEPVEKFHYYRRLMESSAQTPFKRAATIYVLDRLFQVDLGLFRKALVYAKAFPELHSYYLARYYALSGNCRGLERLSRKSLPARALYTVCTGKKWKGKGINFYNLLLSPPEEFPFDKKRISSGLRLSDEGLKILYQEGFCSAISFIDNPSPQNALASYLCGDFRKGIKLAAPFKGKLRQYPYLLPVLYPKPPVFGDDLISLSIARQESLFDERALSRSGAIGLMQIMPFTGKHIAEKLNVNGFEVHHLYRPDVNYRFGSYYIYMQLKRFKLFPLAAAAYNCGPSRVARALKRFGKIETPEDLILFTDVYLPFQETRDYVKRTYVNLYYYSNLYGKGTEWKIFSGH